MAGRLHGFGLASFILLVVACDGGTPFELGAMPVRVTPIGVETDGRPAWELFDRDTFTAPSAAAGPTSIVLLDGILLHRVRAFGRDATVRVTAGGATLGEIVLPSGAAGWSTLTLDERTVVSELAVETTEVSDDASLSELDLWALGPELPVDMEPTVGITARELAAMGADLFASEREDATLDARGEACASFEIGVAREPGAYRRAWLRYRTIGAFRHWALSRAINGGPAMRGHAVPADDEARSFVHRIDPELLVRGANRVELCAPGAVGLSGPIHVSGVELVLELDHGSNVVDIVAVAPAGGIATEDASQLLRGVTVSLGSGEELVVALDRLLHVDRVDVESSAAAWAIRCVEPTGAEVDLGLTEVGVGQFQVEGAPAACAGLRLQPSSAADVSSLRVYGSGAARRIDFPQIVLASAREHFGHEAFVDGWARAPSRVGGGAVVTIDDAMTAGGSGAFGQRIVRGTDPTAVWPVEIRATFADGSTFSRGYVLDHGAGRIPGSTGPGSVIDDGLTAEERARRFGEVGQRVEADVSAGSDTHVELGTDVSLDIPAGAVRGRTTVSITHLGPESLPALNPGMVNVTAPFAHGYEMLPHGQEFDEPVTVTLPYQPSLLLEGYGPQDVETYYYDTEDLRWEPLARASVDEARQITQSLTDHFTVMISALVVAPEHPTVASFDPNRMSGIEPASPGAGINVIAPPTASSRGDANLSYPLDLPGGRRGMQPSLALVYSSSRENGWLGVGWDLPVSSIEIDTRFGVPRYDPDLETETYMLDGGQLSPVAHRAEPVRRRGADFVFHERVEGSFSRIIRRGSSPSTYYWEVIDRAGVRSFYGGTTSGRDASAILADDDGNGFRWMLREVVDTFGNRVVYEYARTDFAVGTGVTGRDLYLASVHYTSRVGESPSSAPYHVTLLRNVCTADGGVDCRPDVSLSARGGFVQATSDRLARVEVRFGSTLVRAWDLGYEVGSFERSRLVSITQFGVGGVPFAGNVHRFTYFDDLGDPGADEVLAFSGATTWNGGEGMPDGVNLPSIFGPEATVSSLGGARTTFARSPFYIGFNPTQGSKDGSGGLTADHGFSFTEGMAALVDLDGDGLPDRVRAGNGGYGYHRNLGDGFASDFVVVDGLSDLSESLEFLFGTGTEGYYGGASFHANVTIGLDMETTYLSDVNGDGLVDLVAGGNVYFNRLEGGVPRFRAGSEGTPLPIGTGALDRSLLRGTGSIDGLDPTEVSPPIDLVRRFVAPYDGRVRITGPIARARDAPSGDGLVASIQHEGEAFYTQAFTGTDSHVATPSIERLVRSGDRLYFRVHALENGANDWLDWAPVVEYLDVPEGVDENGLSVRRFSAADDFVAGGRPGGGVLMPFAGRAHLTGTLRKLRTTSDDIEIRLVLRDPAGVVPDLEVFARTVSGSTTGDITLDRSFDVAANQLAVLSVSTDSPIDLGAIQWGERPRPFGPPRIGPWLSYDDATGPDGAALPVRDDAGEPVGFDVPFTPEISVYTLQRGSAPPTPTLASSTVEVRWLTRFPDGELPAPGTDDRLTITVKSDGELLAARTVTTRADGMRRSAVLTVPASSGPMFVSVTAHDPGLFRLTTVDGPADGSIPVSFYGAEPSLRIAPSYRGWSFVGYNAGGGRGGLSPIDPDVLEAVEDRSAGEDRAAREGAYDRIDSDRDGRFDLDPDGDGVADLGAFGAMADDFDASEIAIPMYPRLDGACRVVPDPDPSVDDPAVPFDGLDCEAILGPHWAGPPAVETRATEAAPPDIDVLFGRATTVGASHPGLGGATLPGTTAPWRRTTSVNAAIGGSAGFLIGGASGSASLGFGHGHLDYFDLNGDSYPDVIGSEGGMSAQYTSAIGALTPTVPLISGSGPSSARLSGDVHHTDTAGLNGAVSIGTSAPAGTSSESDFAARAQAGTAPGRSSGGSAGGTDTPAVGFDLNIGATLGGSDTTEDFQDINGDGLPDRVRRTSGGLEVQLNLGYRFTAPCVWRQPIPGWIHRSNSDGLTNGAGLGVAVGDYSFGGGLAMERSWSFTSRDDGGGTDETHYAGTLLDMNGDGLLDRVIPRAETDEGGAGFLVYVNLGYRFSEAGVLWRGTLSHDDRAGSPRQPTSSDSTSLSGSGYFTFSVGPICYGVACYLIFNIGASGGESISRTATAIRDIDGDGFPDHLGAPVLGSSRPQDLRVARSLVRRTNLLRSVVRPLGARVDLDYERSANTAEMAGSRWVLSSVHVFDGQEDAVAGRTSNDHTLTRFRYEDGVYDRFERELFGFGTVTVDEIDTRTWDGTSTTPTAVYRRAITSFDTTNYATRGLVTGTRLEDGTGRAFAETANVYALLDLEGRPSSVTRVRAGEPTFPALTVTQRRTLEGGADAMVRTESMQYDAVGNVTRYVDAGGPGGDDDVVAEIRYSASDGSCAASNIIGVPVAISVRDLGAHLLSSRTSSIDCDTGVVTELREALGGGAEAVTSLAYDGFGNLSRVVMPENRSLTGPQRYALNFAYDGVVHTYVTSVTDSFGYGSSTEYDLRFGLPTREVDLNGERVLSRYDAHGRVTEVVGPLQPDDLPTLSFAYAPTAPVPVARTTQLDRAGDPILISTFTDGLGRALQTQRDGTVHTGDETMASDVAIVSGRVEYDPWGRVTAIWHPTTAPETTTLFEDAEDAITPTTLAYDVRDRLLATTLPDGSTTSRAISLAPGLDGAGFWQRTLTTDAEGSQAETYTDARDRIRAVVEHIEGRTPTTRYDHDPLDRLVRIVDAAGNTTTATYDLGGRRVALDQPDAGLVMYEYDPAGNMVSRVTPNLRARGGEIRYAYDFTHLVSVDYPFTASDVTYTWGASGAPEHGAGRVVSVSDATGTETRGYDALGQLVRETRTIFGRGGDEPHTYTSRSLFDTWGRMQQMVYPNGEVLTYEYDSGGLVRRAVGVLGADTFPYVERLEYDAFGQRVFEQAGNGIRSHFHYDPETRRIARLEAGEFQSLDYDYDLVGNITALTNTPLPTFEERMGGNVSQTFGYDELHRLTHATGEWTRAGGRHRAESYTFDSTYSDTHDIVHRTQAHTASSRPGASHTVPVQRTSYDYGYSYSADHPHAPTTVGERTLSYDLNGNLVSMVEPRSSLRRTLVWDEEDRITSISDNGRTTEFVYDDEGQRTIKRGPRGETVYAFPTWVVRAGTIGTSHVFVGSTRVASHVWPGRSHVDPPPDDALGGMMGRWWEHRSDSGFAHARNTEMNPHYRVDPTTPMSGRPETQFLYFYHPDHLGSTEFVTDTDGELYEHAQYFPSGESWVREDDGADRLPWLFTSQELDAETGFYYLNARYYDPRVGTFASTDPALRDLYFDARQSNMAFRGVYDTRNMSAYCYAYNSPIVYSDPTGLCPPCALIAIGAIALYAWGSTPLHAGDPGDGGHRPSEAAAYSQMVLTMATPSGPVTGAAAGVASVAVDDADRGEMSSPGTYAVAGTLGAVAGAVGGRTSSPTASTTTIARETVEDAAREAPRLLLPEVTHSAAAALRQSASRYGLRLRWHAIVRLAGREAHVPMRALRLAIDRGRRFRDPTNNSIVYFLEGAFASGRSLLVSTNADGEIITIISGRTRNLLRPRFVPMP